MTILRILTILIGLVSVANAQTGNPVKQTGAVTAGHIPYWATNGIIGDGGTAAAGGPITSIGVVASGTGICQLSGVVTGAYNALCFNTTTSGGGGFSLNNVGGATGGFTLTLNGVTQTFVTSATTFTTNDVVCASSASVLKDCGFGITAGTTNQLAYWTSATAQAGLATANNGVLITSAGGVPSISSTLPSAVLANITALSNLQSVAISPLVNTTPLTISGGSITGSNTTNPGISVTGTVNTSGVLTGAALFVNILNTASGGGSKLVDFQIGGNSQFSLAMSSGAVFSANLTAAGQLTNSGIASSAQADVVCTTSAGVFSYQVSATGCAASSVRFKQDLHPISDDKALQVALNLKSESYHYRPETKMGDDIHFGFTAEQVETVDPHLITYEDDGQPHAVKYNELWPFFAGGMRKLQAEIDDLKSGTPSCSVKFFSHCWY